MLFLPRRFAKEIFSYISAINLHKSPYHISSTTVHFTSLLLTQEYIQKQLPRGVL